MARRGQRKGDWLASDDYTGFSKFASQLKQDYWGNETVKPLKRNLQEIARGFADPYPVPFNRGPNYEQTDGETAYLPQFIGNTNIPFPQSSFYAQVVLPELGGIGYWYVEDTFVVS